MDFLTVCYCCDKIGACFPKGEEEEAGGRVGRHNRMGGGGRRRRTRRRRRRRKWRRFEGKQVA